WPMTSERTAHPAPGRVESSRVESSRVESRDGRGKIAEKSAALRRPSLHAPPPPPRVEIAAGEPGSLLPLAVLLQRLGDDLDVDPFIAQEPFVRPLLDAPPAAVVQRHDLPRIVEHRRPRRARLRIGQVLRALAVAEDAHVVIQADLLRPPA